MKNQEHEMAKLHEVSQFCGRVRGKKCRTEILFCRVKLVAHEGLVFKRQSTLLLLLC